MRLTHLRLWAANVAPLHTFYAQVLELPITQFTADRLELVAGDTTLVFERAPAGWNDVYHFAFNIPPHLFAEAKAWLRQRTSLISDSTGADDFSSTPASPWDARMFYFYDPAGNVLELIARNKLARNELATTALTSFNSKHLLNISEIGLATMNVPETVARIETAMGLQRFNDASETFGPVGDHNGLFIVVKHGRIWFPETGRPAHYAPVTATIINPAHQTYTLELMVDGQLSLK